MARYSASTYEKAIKVLDGVIEIAKNEQVRHVGYLSGTVVRHDLAEAGAICGGRQACLVGSLWLAAGVKPTPTEYWEFPGIAESERDEFLRARHPLRLAYDALNSAAAAYQAKHFARYRGFRTWDANAEHLFEDVLRNRKKADVRDHVIAVARQAKRSLQREARAAA